MAVVVRGELTGDGSGFSHMLDEAGDEIAKLNNPLEGLKESIGAAFSVGFIAEQTRALMEFGEAVQNAAERLNVSTDSAQQLSFAAQQAGSDLGLVENGLDRLARAGDTALNTTGEGAERLVEAFDRLGISVQDLQTMTPEQMFRKIGEGLHDVEMDGQKTADMMQIFGRGAGQLVPILKDLKDKSEELKESGLTLSSQEIKNLHESEAAWKKWSHAVMEAFGMAGSGIVQGMQLLAKGRGNLSAGLDMKNAEEEGKKLDAQLAEMNRKRDEAKKAAAEAANPAGPRALTPGEQKAHDKEIAKMDEDTARLNEKHRLAGMTDQQKMAELATKQAAAVAMLKGLQFAGGGDSDMAHKLRNEIAKDQESMDALKSKEKEPSHVVQTKRVVSDSLTKVGNFLGSSPTQISNIGERTNQILLQIHATLKTISTKGGNPLDRSGHPAM